MQPVTGPRIGFSPPPGEGGARPKAAKPIKRDPAPSRWAYRVHRMWLTPLYRRLLRIGVPVFLILSVSAWYVSNPTNRFAIEERVSDVRRSIETRPEFTVRLMAVEGASPVVDRAIRETANLSFPMSSFDLDLPELREKIAAFDVVESVNLRVRPGGVLEVAVIERDPVILWRTGAQLELLDDTGHRVASLPERAARADLPLITGAGGEDHVREALVLFKTAAPIATRLRGLVRVGERRWDLVLDRDQRILLPEVAPVAALEQVLALNEAQELLDRDLTHIDMRNPARPTLRMTQPAVDEYRRIRSLDHGDPR